MNPFKKNQDYSLSPNRNTFDLSFQNNLTCNFGQLIPCMCKEVMPGDSFRINAKFALRFMPLVFPVQTKCRAYLHFFYQRNKNLWKDFNDFINNNKTSLSPSNLAPGNKLMPPYLSQTGYDSRFATGSIGDYLNIPTTINSKAGSSYDVSLRDYSVNEDILPVATVLDISVSNKISNKNSKPFSFPSTPLTKESLFNLVIVNSEFRGVGPVSANLDFFSSYLIPSTSSTDYSNFYKCIGFNLDDTTTDESIISFGCSSDNIIFGDLPVYAVLFSGESSDSVLATDVLDVDLRSFIDSNGITRYTLNCVLPAITKTVNKLVFYCPVSSFRGHWQSGQNYTLKWSEYLSQYQDVSSNNIFSLDNKLPISALPFRCYESIYNAFYRDSRNNPLLIGGQPEYNKYLVRDTGGLDPFNYHIHNRNWELDQFTSAVQSPQQGTAPLVGISSLGAVTFQSLEDGKEYTFNADTAEDSDTITRINVTENVPNSVARSIVDVATSGISINDFRNVNAYQRWLETNIRRGLKIKDQIKARWGVDIKESLLDMPEFLGGVSCDVDINTVSQTSETENSPLGAYAGQATAFGGSDNDINVYCDQHGYIMAILSVVPSPIYTQILPKHFSKFSPLDYYSPEFGQIGMQSVTYRELCPVQSVLSGKDVDETFGYQRPWHEYLFSNDEAHGDFRTTLHNFILNREFSEPPKLDASFTTINNDELNNVFATEFGHKILGQIRFDIKAQRPIPSVSIPGIQ